MRRFFYLHNINSEPGDIKQELLAIFLVVAPAFWPGLASIVQFFFPGIAASFLAKNELKRSLNLLLVAFLLGSLVGIFLSVPSVPLMLAHNIVIAGMILLSLKKGASAPATLLAGTIGLLIMELVFGGFLSAGDFKAIYNNISKSMLSEFDKGIALYKESYGKEFPVQLQEVIDNIRQTLITFLPALLCTYLFFAVFLNIIAFQKAASTINNGQNLLPDFAKWHMPEALIWLFIIFGFMALLPQEKYYLIGKNGVFVVSLFYLIQGFSIIKYFFHIYETPLFARILIYILIGIQWYGLLLVVFTGLMDNWFDLREKIKRSHKVS